MSKKYPSFETLQREKGFNFGPGRHAWIGDTVAMDAAIRMQTAPNTTVPIELYTVVDPIVVEILTAPLAATEIFSETKKTDWAMEQAIWRVTELIGRTQEYTDFANNGVSDVNYNWKRREHYRFETVIEYGDLETEMTSVAKVNLAGDKQRAAAQAIAIDANKFYLLGVQGREIDGLLNDPNLPAAITPIAGAGGGLTWDGKTTTEIYNDILLLFAQLAKQSNGRITRNDQLKLLLSPEMEVMLGKATDFNKSVLEMLNTYFGNLTIVTLPEMRSLTAGDSVMLVCTTVAGTPTGDLGFSEKIRAGRIVPLLSSMRQKWSSGSYGGVVTQPFAYATMVGTSA